MCALTHTHTRTRSYASARANANANTLQQIRLIVPIRVQAGLVTCVRHAQPCRAVPLIFHIATHATRSHRTACSLLGLAAIM